MYLVNTCKNGLIYSDGNLSITKFNDCSHARFDVTVSNESVSAVSSQLLDPKLFEHELNDFDLAAISLWSVDDHVYPMFIVFKSVDAYQACCKVLGITPDSYLVENGKTVITHEL